MIQDIEITERITGAATWRLTARRDGHFITDGHGATREDAMHWLIRNLIALIPLEDS